MKIPPRLRPYLPVAGRLTSSQIEHLGRVIKPPAFINWGHVIVLIDLPERFQKADPEESLADLNAQLAEFFADLSEYPGT